MQITARNVSDIGYYSAEISTDSKSLASWKFTDEEISEQLYVVHPNAKEAVGNLRTLNSDPLFLRTQKVILGFDLKEKVVLTTPVVPHS